jgi:hypothetical protein
MYLLLIFSMFKNLLISYYLIVINCETQHFPQSASLTGAVMGYHRNNNLIISLPEAVQARIPQFDAL